MAEYRLGVDIGGTFTDVVLLASDGALNADADVTVTVSPASP